MSSGMAELLSSRVVDEAIREADRSVASAVGIQANVITTVIALGARSEMDRVATGSETALMANNDVGKQQRTIGKEVSEARCGKCLWSRWEGGMRKVGVLFPQAEARSEGEARSPGPATALARVAMGASPDLSPKSIFEREGGHTASASCSKRSIPNR